MARFQKTLIFPIDFNDFMELRCQLGSALELLWCTLGSLWDTLGSLWLTFSLKKRPLGELFGSFWGDVDVLRHRFERLWHQFELTLGT